MGRSVLCLKESVTIVFSLKIKMPLIRVESAAFLFSLIVGLSGEYSCHVEPVETLSG